jgi:hypothetical protein
MSGAPMLKLVGTSTIPSRRLCRVPCGKPLAYRKAFTHDAIPPRSRQEVIALGSGVASDQYYGFR